MDTFGRISIIPFLVLLVGGVAGFVWFARYNARAALVTAIILFIGRNMVDTGGSRLLHGLMGLLGMVCLLGGVVAVFALAREPAYRPRDDQSPPNQP